MHLGTPPMMLQTVPMTQSAGQAEKTESTLPIMRWWWVTLAGLLTLLGTFASLIFLLKYTQGLGSADQARANLDAIRTALSIAVGTGGAFALWLAARRQRSTEIQLAENARIANDSRLHQERVAESNDFDTRERRITDLYSKAVEQLGSDKAPVRLGGLYALERLGQGNADHLQTIINIFCAYLRMPFHLPEDTGVHNYRSAPYSALKKKDEDALRPYEELQVRLTVQRLLKTFLQQGDGHPKNSCNCKKVFDVDLRGALLIGLDLRGCHIGAADFGHTRFASTPHFRQTIFREDAWFYEATFDCVVDFNDVTFLDRAIFTRCMFPGRLGMRRAQFRGEAYFEAPTLGSEANFEEASFHGNAKFIRCKLTTAHYKDFHMAENGWPPPKFKFAGATASAGDSLQFEWPPGWEALASGEHRVAIVRATEAERVVLSADTEPQTPGEARADHTG